MWTRLASAAVVYDSEVTCRLYSATVQPSKGAGKRGGGVELCGYQSCNMDKLLAFGQVGSYELGADVFGVPIRRDILHRVVRWQLAKRQQVSCQEFSGCSPFHRRTRGRTAH